MSDVPAGLMLGAVGGPLLATIFGLAICAVVARQFEGTGSGIIVGVISGGGAMLVALVLFSFLFAASVVDFGELQQKYEDKLPPTEQSN